MVHRKRKRDTKAPEKFEWVDEEAGLLLAWLDHYVDQNLHRTLLIQSIAHQLSKKWKRDFTESRVENKLRSMHHRYHDDEKRENTSIAAIYRKGTRCFAFSWVEPELKAAFENAKSEVQREIQQQPTPFIPEEPKSAELALERSVQLKSDDATVEGYTGNTPEQPDTALSTHSDRIHEIIQDSKTNVLSKFSEDKEANVETYMYDPFKHVKKVLSQPYNADQPGTRDDQSLLSINAVEASDTSETVSDDRAEHPFPATGESNPVALATESDFGLPSIERASGTSEMEKLKAMVKQLTAENARLHNALHTANKTREAQDFNWRKASNDTQSRIFELYERLGETGRLLDRSRKMNNFFNKSAYSDYTPSQLEVKQVFESLYLESKKMLQNDDDLDICIPQEFTAVPVTESLVNGTIREPILSGDTHRDTQCPPRRESAQFVVQNITGAALKSWIFEGSWPNFDEEKSQLLRIYRQCIANGKDGMETLKALDSAAYYFLLDEKGFSDSILPIKAEELADRLVDTFVTIFSKWLPQENRSRVLDLLRQQKTLCTQIMTRALELKRDMLLCEEFYHLVDIEPGEAFNPNTMSLEISSEIRLSDTKQDSQVVRICVFPGLSLRKSPLPSINRSTDILSKWQDALVRHEMSEGDYTIIDAETLIVSKAIVALEEKTA